MGQDLTDAIPAVDNGNRTCVNFELRLVDRRHHPVFYPIAVPAKPQHTAGLVPPEIGLDQAVGDQRCIGFGKSQRPIASRPEVA